MNLATKIIVSEIDILIDKAKKISEDFINSEHELPAKLYGEIQYFCTRVKYIFTNTPKVDTSFISVINNFSNQHLMLTKSFIKGIELNKDIVKVTACLRTLKIELENNLLYNVTELINAEIFDTHLESAKHLLEKGYKDAAAVIIGGVLEDKLRQLSSKHNLPLKDNKGKYFTIDPLNNNLYTAGIYNLTVQKEIIPFADIRNNAAHGKYESYDKKQVANFYQYVLDFNQQ